MRIHVHLILVLALLSSFGSMAQNELYIDGGQLYAKQSALIHIEGSMQNKYTSTLKNDGVIELMGNLSNDSTAFFTIGTDSTSTERLVKFIGASTQIVSGSFSDTVNHYFYNLLIDKSVSGTAVQLGTSASVKGSLVYGSVTTGANTYTPTATSSLTNNSGLGLIKTYDTLNNDYELYITNPSVNALKGYAALAINGAPADGYIADRGAKGIGVGGLSRNVSQLNTAYIFPVGSVLNGYNAAGITFTTLGSSTDKVRGLFVDATGGVGSLSKYCSGCGTTPYGTGFNYYFAVDSCDGNKPQWVILNKLPTDHGYWSYTGNAADVYSLEMYPNSFTAFGSATGAMWRVIKDTGSMTTIPTGDWTGQIVSSTSGVNNLLKYTSMTGCYSGSGVPGGRYTGFGEFQLARNASGTGLPVELVSFTAMPMDDTYIQLKWLTASESDNRGFQILRSTDGVTFTEIGWMDGHGTTTEQSNYSYNDENVESNIRYYYKLNQQDYDGNSKETYIVEAQISKDNTTAISISSFYPNPANNSTRISIHSNSDIKVNIELYNMIGQMLDKNILNAQAGDSQFELSTDRLPAGIYKAVVQAGTSTFINSLNIIR